MKARLTIAAAILAAACSNAPENAPDAEVDSADAEFDAQDAGDATPPVCDEVGQLEAGDARTVQASTACPIAFELPEPSIVELLADVELPWSRPQLLQSGTHTVEVDSATPATVNITNHGSPVQEVQRDRSLVWTDPALVDDKALVGLTTLMRAASGGGEPAVLFHHWLSSFASTAHSERVGPRQFLDELVLQHGPDPGQWDLDALPFVATAVHNRTDLANEISCGELRVSLASTDAIFQPFHAIFLFDQPAGEGDIGSDGTVHCMGTLRKWARLSELDGAAFLDAARLILQNGLVAERFVMAETVEFIISPWEWRQWLPTPNPAPTDELPIVLENPPLFQTVNADLLNRPGATRDQFLTFVRDNAEALDARTVLLPEQFRAPSARVNAGVPWIPLELDADLDQQFPDLRRNIEIMGCPACHATDAEFIQTRPDRTFSPFYDKELDARAEHLRQAHVGVAPPAPFGPLQADPLLPP